MLLTPDYKKSVAKNKLILHESWYDNIGEYLLRFVFGFSLFFYPLLVIPYLGSENSANEIVLGSVVIIGGQSAFWYFTYQFITMYKLIEFTGINRKVNRKLVRQIAKEYEWKIQIDDRNYLSAFHSGGIFSMGQQITILFHGDKILFNSITVGNLGVRLPFSIGENGVVRGGFRKSFRSLLKRYSMKQTGEYTASE